MQIACEHLPDDDTVAPAANSYSGLQRQHGFDGPGFAGDTRIVELVSAQLGPANQKWILAVNASLNVAVSLRSSGLPDLDG